MSDNLARAMGNMLAMEEHLSERVAVAPHESPEQRDAQQLLDDARAVRQKLSEFEGDELVWCGYKHGLVAYVNSLEEVQKRARRRAPLLNVDSGIRHIYKLLERIEAFAKKYPGEGPDAPKAKVPKKR